MTISDYIQELEQLKRYMVDVKIPYIAHVICQDLTLDKHYNNAHYPSQGKVFKCHIFPCQIPSFQDYKDGKDMTYFGTIIQ